MRTGRSRAIDTRTSRTPSGTEDVAHPLLDTLMLRVALASALAGAAVGMIGVARAATETTNTAVGHAAVWALLLMANLAVVAVSRRDRRAGWVALGSTALQLGWFIRHAPAFVHLLGSGWGISTLATSLVAVRLVLLQHPDNPARPEWLRLALGVALGVGFIALSPQFWH